MSVSDKYQIEQRYIRIGNSRPGTGLTGPLFIVAHETANNSADADDHFAYFNNSQPSASAHTFIDDGKILEIIPLNEKAYHNLYTNPEDNRLFGADANDAAIGVELCRTGVFREAYDRYVWYHAYLCRRFNLDPSTKIVAHSTLDPRRRTDPESWLVPNGVTFAQFLRDVRAYYNAWDSSTSPPIRVQPPERETGSEVDTTILRRGDSGADVTFLQRKLISLGYPLPRFGADGTFGAETEAAVRQFQQEQRIRVDGIVGPETFGRLNRAKPRRPKPFPGTLYRLKSPYMRGSNIGEIQKKLGVPADSIYGPVTAQAVRNFQRREGIKVDGIVGPVTWARLFR